MTFNLASSPIQPFDARVMLDVHSLKALRQRRGGREALSEQFQERRQCLTRAAINQALMDLIAEREYDDITVGDIIGKADIGRSTFYQHYQNKDEVFRAVVMGGMEACADSAVGGDHLRHLTDWLQIFWDNRKAGRVMLTASHTRQFISRSLAELMLERLEGITIERLTDLAGRLFFDTVPTLSAIGPLVQLAPMEDIVTSLSSPAPASRSASG